MSVRITIVIASIRMQDLYFNVNTVKCTMMDMVVTLLWVSKEIKIKCKEVVKKSFKIFNGGHVPIVTIFYRGCLQYY